MGRRQVMSSPQKEKAFVGATMKEEEERGMLCCTRSRNKPARK
jgi:hypothetical protein